MGASRVVHGMVGLIDVAPTLLDLLHLQDPLGRQFQGMSLASDIVGKGATREHPVYSETYYPRDSFGWSELRAIATDRFKYIQAPHPELYDLPHDRLELHNLCGERASLAAALRQQLEGLVQHYDSASGRAAAHEPPLSPETVEKLRSLGYTALAAPVQPISAGPLPDPKDRLKIFKGILRAQDLSTLGRREQSNRLLQSLAAEEPNLYVLPFLEADNLASDHRWHDAEQSYLASLKINPKFERALMGLAHAYLGDGEPEKAKPLLELVVHVYPRNFLALYALGRIARREGKHEKAYRYLVKAVSEKPYVGLLQQELGFTLVDLERYQEALEPLTRAQKLGVEDPRLEHYLGTALASVGRFKEAVSHYQKALEAKPDLAETRLSLAFAYLNLGEQAAAKREFRTFCQQSPSRCQQYRKSFE